MVVQKTSIFPAGRDYVFQKYFRDPETREFDMQHEQWLFGGEQYTAPVLQAIDEFMDPRG